MKKPVMSFRSDNGASTVDVYLLNAGEVFEGFGGSKSGLRVHKTASLITRHKTPMSLDDREWDVDDEGGWRWIRSLITKYGYELQGQNA